MTQPLAGDAVAGLTNESVAKAFAESLSQTAISGDTIKVEAITGDVVFSSKKLEEHRQQVFVWINDLPLEFLTGIEGGGGGWTFLNLCNRRDGKQWTGEHSTMQKLCAMAIGLGLAKWLMPRDMWDVLPGGMPYVQFSCSLATGAPS